MCRNRWVGTAVLCTVIFSLLQTSSVWSKDAKLLTLYWAPYIYKTENGRPEGVAVKLVDTILKPVGLNLEPDFQPWPRVYKTIQTDDDVLVFTMVRFPDREPLFNWLAPLFVSEPGVLIYDKATSPQQPKTVAELRKLRVCATLNNTFYQKLTALGFEPQKNLFEFQTLFPDQNSDAQFPTFERKCDFLTTNWAPFVSLLRKRGINKPNEIFAYYPFPERALGPDMQTYLVASKNMNPDTVNAIRASADALLKAGTLHAICKDEYEHDDFTCRMLKPN